MYTATKLSHADDKQTQRRIVTIKFQDVSIPHEFVKDFSFRLTDSIDVMKAIVKSYLDELNAVITVLPDGAVDTTVTPAPVVPPTAAELARTEWEADVARLRKAYTDMLDLGVVPKPAMVTALDALRTKIANNVKAEYLG